MQKTNMKQHLIQRLIRQFGIFIFAFFCSLTCFAQTFPSKPIKIIVPFGPGGIADLTARIVAQKMSSNLGQGVVIENKPSAGGVVAADLVAKSEPDGYTLLLMSNGTAISANLFQKLPYDTLKDFEPLSTLGFFDIAIVASESSKYLQLKDLIQAAQTNPGKLNIGSINIGSTQNLAAELFKSSANLDIQVVPFNGTPAVITALRGGQIDAGVEILGPLVPQIKSKAVRLLAVTGNKRSNFFPDVPTVTEMGLKNFTASSWNGLAAPAKTPPTVVNLLNKTINDAVNDPEVKGKLQDIFVEAHSSSIKDARTLLENDIKRWGNIIDKAHIPKQ
jgi:tripartite-type tricarboxylate transporter receptor subunit TctC